VLTIGDFILPALTREEFHYMMMPAELQAIHRYVVETPLIEDVTEIQRQQLDSISWRAGQPSLLARIRRRW
jgi:hypothetical protein